MPLRATSLQRPASTTGWDALQIYRRLRWGRLAHIHLLDSRQYRSWQACRTPDASSAPAVRPADCAELAQPQRSLLGSAQERWLDAGLAADAASAQATRWSVIAQQTLFSSRGKVGKTQALQAAASLGLNPITLEMKMGDPKVTAAIDKSYDIARKLDITGTPTYIIGNEVIPGAVGIDDLRTRIANMRKCGDSVCS